MIAALKGKKPTLSAKEKRVKENTVKRNIQKKEPQSFEKYNLTVSVDMS